MMDTIGLPYLLTVAVLLFVIGCSRALAGADRRRVPVGTFLMLAGACIALIGFICFLPVYVAKPWVGYGGLLLIICGMVRSGVRIAEKM